MSIKENTMMNYIAKYYEKDLESIKLMYNEMGDLGEVAAECLRKSPVLLKTNPHPLNVTEVINEIYNIKDIEGKDSMKRKYHIFMKIMNTTDPLEAKYLVKILHGTLRIGVNANSIIKVLQHLEGEYENDEDYAKFLLNCESSVFGYVVRDKPKFLKVGTPVNCMLGRSAK